MKKPFFTSMNYFSTPVWKGHFPQYLKDCISVTDPHIKKAKIRNASLLKKHHKKKVKDFGMSHHSGPIYNEPALQPFVKFIMQVSGDFLETCGFDLQRHKAWLSECWVQEFSKQGGGHHSAHVHSNNHVSGFYFLKCSDSTSYPVFEDPRSGAMMNKLPLKKSEDITSGSDQINIQPQPGTLLVFPAYLLHHFPVDRGIDPFRFIHFNIQYLPGGAVIK